MIPTLRSLAASLADFLREVAAIRRDLAEERRGAATRATERARRREDEGR